MNRLWMLSCFLGVILLVTGQLPADDLLVPRLKTLDDHFPMVVPATAEQWSARAAELRRRVLVATGLWPLPDKTPLQEVIHGKVEREGFTVERVYFQSLPGHYVTGLLFRPSAANSGEAGSKRRPAVLSPHGHGGRAQRFTDQQLADQLQQGAEHFEKSGQMPKLARCAQLARMGCVTFIFDMLGYADSVQISHDVAHRFSDVADQDRTLNDSWGFYSIQADLRLQSIMGLQTWNAIRALDFLASLPDVDPDRLAVTGGSGGGTQTILLGAIDDRVKVGFPNGMVSTSMQGGCYCENCNLLRIDTGNVELAALFAPRPQAMTAADDWTRDMMTDGYPELQKLYSLVGRREDVYCRPMLNFKHNYNYVTRATMYQWFNRHLQLGLDDPVIEQDYEPLTDEEMSVWNEAHPRPAETGIEHEGRVCNWFDQQANQKLSILPPDATQSWAQWLETLRGAWEVIFDQTLPDDVSYTQTNQRVQDGMAIETGSIQRQADELRIPIVRYRQQGGQSRRVVIWSHGPGTLPTLDDLDERRRWIHKLVDENTDLIVAELTEQGALQTAAPDQQPLIPDKRPYSAFTFGYNRTVVVRRTADLLAVVRHVASGNPDSIRLLGTDDAAFWVVPAALRAGAVVDSVAISNGDERLANAKSYRDVNFVPGAVKYGDLPALLALRAPHRLTVISAAPMPPIVQQAYRASSSIDAVQWQGAANVDQAIFAWSHQK